MKKPKCEIINRVALFLLLPAAISFYNTACAQDSILNKQTERKMNNIIKYNITSSLLYENSFQFAYERMINSKRSISVWGGPVEFPSSLSLPFFSNMRIDNRSGYTFGADYRFYLLKENKYAAPRGLYLAPFVANYHFTSDRSSTYTDSAGTSDLKLYTKVNFLNVGCQLGYQFIIKKHFTIDIVMFGPAITAYKFNAKVDGAISDELKNKLNEDIIDELINRLPLLGDLSSSGEASESGVKSFWSAGFRYNISIGYRF